MNNILTYLPVYLHLFFTFILKTFLAFIFLSSK